MRLQAYALSDGVAINAGDDVRDFRGDVSTFIESERRTQFGFTGRDGKVVTKAHPFAGHKNYSYARVFDLVVIDLDDTCACDRQVPIHVIGPKFTVCTNCGATIAE
jgi:hypothetical protein